MGQLPKGSDTAIRSRNRPMPGDDAQVAPIKTMTQFIYGGTGASKSVAWDDFVLPAREPFRDALRRYGVEHLGAHLDELAIEPGQVVHCSNLAADAQVRPYILTTGDLDIFKRWIGFPNDLPAGLGHTPVKPSRPAPSPHLVTAAHLDAAAWQELEQATKAYLFGNSELVRAYKPVIERVYAPFRTAVYVVRRLVIKPGGRLVVRDMPAALLFDDVIIHDGGQIMLHTITNMTIRSLCKCDAPPRVSVP